MTDYSDMSLQVQLAAVNKSNAVPANELRAAHQAGHLTRRINFSYLPASEYPDEGQRTKLASLILRSELSTLAKQYNVRADRLLQQMELECIRLVTSSQGDCSDRIQPLTDEEQVLVNKTKLRKNFAPHTDSE